MIQICPQCRAEYRDEAKFCINDGTRLVTKGTSSDPLVGTLIGDRYILERQLGRGSHGFVYRATHNEIPRAYAIKFLRPSFGGHLAPDFLYEDVEFFVLRGHVRRQNGTVQ